MARSASPSSHNGDREPIREFRHPRDRSRSRSPGRRRGRERSSSRERYSRPRHRSSKYGRRSRSHSRSRSRSPYSRSGGGRYPRDRDGFGGGRFEERGGRGSHRGGFRGRARGRRYGTDEQLSSSKILFIGNIPYSYTSDDFTQMFSKYGPITKVTVPMDRDTGKNRGFCFVEFQDRRDAEEALGQYQGRTVEGRKLRCDFDIGLDKKEAFKDDTRPGGDAPSNSTLTGDRERSRDAGSNGAFRGYRGHREGSMSPPRERRDSPDYNAPFA